MEAPHENPVHPPRQAWANIQRMLADYPQVYGPYGFYDALDPVTGAVGHRTSTWTSR